MKTSDELKREIELLIPKAETGAQWAEICRIEAEMVAALCREMAIPHEVRQ